VTVHADDLPPELRKQVMAAAKRGDDRARVARAATPPKPAPRARPVRLPYCKVRCEACGEVFAAYGKAVEDHADQHHGGARIALVLETEPC
jgi:hypothetical protein